MEDKAEIRRMKIRAREALKRAVRAGRIVKPDPCQGCAGQAGRIVGHHTNYAKPLEVEWLCDRCHEQRHENDLDEQQRAVLFGRRSQRYDPLVHLRDLELETFPMSMEF